MRRSLTGKAKINNKEAENTGVLNALVGTIRCFFPKKEIINEATVREKYYEKRYPVCSIKVLELEDVHYISTLLEIEHIVVANYAKLSNEDRQAFLSDLKVQLWQEGKNFIEIEKHTILCTPDQFDVVKNPEIVRKRV